jgi:exopolysaccharide biosynthesis polyprenyl glycosylphosphotransferase
VGSGTIAEKLARYLRSHPGENRVVVGFVDDQVPVGNDVQGRIHDIPLLAKTRFIDEIIVAGLSGPDALRAIAFAQSCSLDIKIVPDMFGLDYIPVFHQIGDVPAIALREERAVRLEELVKRMLDIGIAAFALALSAPLFGLIAAAIRLDSAGPALYAAERVGFKGRRFCCYKFRTMIVGADLQREGLRVQNERCGASFKLEYDPRVTRIGHWLRQYSLDELPQLWNVLKGEMSLVGPRPHPPDDFARYDIEDLKRLEVIPGLTGLWQVSARKDPSFKLNVQLDREYIEHWSLTTDFKIMLKTVSAVLQGTGS